jgi:AcrR family transcriptional regulator
MKESAVRSRILNVAARLFYEQGYNSTGINQVIAEADIARASLYHHFSSKTDLLMAYLQEAEESWLNKLIDTLAPIDDAEQKLWALFDYRMNRQLTAGFGGCQFVKISAEVANDDQQVFKLVAHQKDQFKSVIKNIVADLKRNYVDYLNNDMLTDTLFLLMEGATVASSIYKNATALNNAKKIAKQLI